MQELQDDHAVVLDMDHRTEANPKCCGLMIDNDPKSTAAQLTEDDKATKEAARLFFLSNDALFPSATSVRVIAVYQASLSPPLLSGPGF